MSVPALRLMELAELAVQVADDVDDVAGRLPARREREREDLSRADAALQTAQAALGDVVLALASRPGRQARARRVVSALNRSGRGFGHFREDDGALAAGGGMSQRETWLIVSDELRGLARDLAQDRPGPALLPTAPCLRALHRRLFRAVDEHAAGRFAPRAPAFAVRVIIGGSFSPSPQRGTEPDQHEAQLADALRPAMELAARAGRPGTKDVAVATAHWYFHTLRIHPFEDGNQRAAWAGLSSLLRALGYPPIRFPDLDSHDRALGEAFAGRGLDALVELLGARLNRSLPE